MDTVTFTTALKKVKLSRNKRSQGGKEPLQQKPEVTEGDKDTVQWKDTPCLWIGRNIIVK